MAGKSNLQSFSFLVDEKNCNNYCVPVITMFSLTHIRTHKRTPHTHTHSHTHTLSNIKSKLVFSIFCTFHQTIICKQKNYFCSMYFAAQSFSERILKRKFSFFQFKFPILTISFRFPNH
jgi:hypothetical protein